RWSVRHGIPTLERGNDQLRLHWSVWNSAPVRSTARAVKDPLGHLLRNAIVHGIETPVERQEKNKPPVGKVELSARQEYGQISITVRDDGAGLDVDKIRTTAAAHQVIAPTQLETMTDNDIAQLVFAPGVTTSTSIDNISGRGTGLDVVKSAVTAVGGSVQVQSVAGQGSCFKSHIPQSMAMVSALLVRVQRATLALPQAQVIEVVGIGAADATRYLTTNMGKPAFVFRNSCVPLYHLQEIATPITASGYEAESPGRSTDINVVVVQYAQRRLALQVDEVVEVADMVIKPLHRYLRHIPILSGGAVLANGKVTFLLDIGGIITWIDGAG
ncbi:MAG: chemotaxis protein CheA, partial [Desulfuromonadaceae bacterium]